MFFLPPRHLTKGTFNWKKSVQRCIRSGRP